MESSSTPQLQARRVLSNLDVNAKATPSRTADGTLNSPGKQVRMAEMPSLFASLKRSTEMRGEETSKPAALGEQAKGSFVDENIQNSPKRRRTSHGGSHRGPGLAQGHEDRPRAADGQGEGGRRPDGRAALQRIAAGWTGRWRQE